MRITVLYGNGRIDVFDDSRFTASEPFGKESMLVNYELRLDRLGDTGLWLSVHHYDAQGDEGSDDPGDSTLVAKRKRGWRFLLAERDEIAHIESIASDMGELAFRVGGDLVDAVRFKSMVDLCVNDAQRKSKARCASELFGIVGSQPGYSLADPVRVGSAFGFSTRSLDATLALDSACAQEDEEEEDWMED